MFASLSPLLRSGLVALAIGSALLACEAPMEEGDDGEADLIGGKKNIPLPATVHIADGCTAAKVGPRQLLTAAHCALNLSTLEPKYDASHPITLSTAKVRARSFEVVKVEAHPAFVAACRETLCSISAVVAKLDAPDVAVVELAEELTGVPVAKIDLRPLVPGDRVIIEGFGCTDGVHQPDSRATPTLTAAETRIVAPDAAVHDGSFVEESDVPVFSGNYALTAGPGASRTGAGLCPGDSGGPLYARRDRKSTARVRSASDLVVVGVNANYTLRPDDVDEAGMPVTNWHTRIDDGSRSHVGTWLAGIVQP